MSQLQKLPRQHHPVRVAVTPAGSAAAGTRSGQRDIGLRKFLALEEQRFAPAHGLSVSKAIAEIRASRILPFAKALPGSKSGLHQLGIRRRDQHLGGVEQLAQGLHTRWAEPGRAGPR